MCKAFNLSFVKFIESLEAKKLLNTHGIANYHSNFLRVYRENFQATFARSFFERSSKWSNLREEEDDTGQPIPFRFATPDKYPEYMNHTRKFFEKNELELKFLEQA